MLEQFDKEAAPIDRKSRAEQDFQLWDYWNKNGQNPDDLRPLLKNFRGLIRSRANRWLGSSDVDIPPAAVNAEFNKQFLNAVQTYNPQKGAALGTWVDYNLKKAPRWLATYRNPARIGEDRFYKVGKYDTAKAILDDQYGREPTTDEMADYLGWSPAEVGRLESERRRTLISSGWETDPMTLTPSREAEVLNLVRYDLTPEELLVYEYTVGYGGKPLLRPSQIAKKMNMNPSKITRIRKSIASKVDKYMKGY